MTHDCSTVRSNLVDQRPSTSLAGKWRLQRPLAFSWTRRSSYRSRPFKFIVRGLASLIQALSRPAQAICDQSPPVTCSLGQAERHIGVKIHILSKKFTYWKSQFLEKFTFLKSHFSQNSRFRNLIFHEIHISKMSYLTKFAFMKPFFTKLTLFKTTCSIILELLFTRCSCLFTFQVHIIRSRFESIVAQSQWIPPPNPLESQAIHFEVTRKA